MEINLPTLARSIGACWTRAENSVTNLIARKHPDPDEENITFLLRGELREAVKQANEKNEFARALETDLILWAPKVLHVKPRLAEGLIARVNFHKRFHEGTSSGADFGLVLKQPRIYEEWGDRCEIRYGSARALLAQAKLNVRSIHHSGTIRWGKLTNAQVELYEEHRKYFSLVLYRLKGGTARSELLPLNWQVCSGAKIKEVEKWLKSGDFPNLLTSESVIEKLSLGEIGTDSLSAIQSVVDPKRADHDVIEIDVSWPDPPPPGGTEQVEYHNTQEVQQIAQLE